MKKTSTSILNDTTAKSIVDNFIAKSEDTKIKRYSNFYKYNDFAFNGNQWSDDDLPDDNTPALSFNQAQDFLDVYLAKLFPRDPVSGVLSVGVKIIENDKNLRDKYEKQILNAYYKNKFAQILLEQGQNFFYGGDACLYYPRIPNTNEVKIISLDPSKVYLGWSGSQLEQFAFEDEISISDVSSKDVKNNWIIIAINYFLGKNTSEINKFEKVKRITYWDNKYQIVKVGDNVKTYKNNDGFIPFSWIPNSPRAHSHEGISEVKRLFYLEKEYNERASNFSDRVKTNTDAIVALMTDKKVSDLTRDDIKKLLKLGQGDDAKILSLPENREILEYLEILSKKMSAKMSLNDAVMGNIKSNVSSLAMIYYFSPLLDKISLKRVQWDQGIRDLNSAILFYAFGKKGYNTDPVYNPVIISDKETQINNTIRLLENRLISHTDAIDELRGVENSEEKFNQIQEEFKKLQMIDGFLNKKRIDSKKEEL